ncbi:transposase [Elizabethkingia anophelis]|uniref:transposase n=1 Tax=Elizabethkingia anophelis TaxID=1117645 RepID=UPI002226FD27|nr:transposase [Elizabethkingia anophelis]MCW2463090.1 transposase [Elizabethkingia anophelis]MCW2466775.1 transposase [Elizabethkingia anophelis]MCW2471077.1 transposase [Elizabethkingia anophelis]HBI9690941.1 transposase [Elizabethkingia anophelis]HBI9694960.1 transposase [Elizabethkingia anophelis]
MENRKFEETESFLETENPVKWDDWEVLKDSKIKLYTGVPIQSKRGNRHYQEEKIYTYFRLVVIKNEKTGKEFWFLTKEIELSAKEISDYYKKRWDIEVCFRFMKQELNLSHLVSLNKNGNDGLHDNDCCDVAVDLQKQIVWTTKPQKRCIKMELRDMITSVLIVFAGGDPAKVYKT